MNSFQRHSLSTRRSGTVLVVACVLVGVFLPTVSSAWTPTIPQINVAVFGGTGDDFGSSVAVDGLGNIYTTGYFMDTVDFDPGAAIFNLTASANNESAFVSKLNSSGEFLWAKQLSGTSSSEGNSIAVDGSGNTYITGFFSATADFDPGEADYNLISAGRLDAFVWKLNSAGEFLWAKQLGGTESENGLSVVVDGNGNVYSTGYFKGTADFDPGDAVYNLTSAVYEEVYVSKLNSAGRFVWAKQLGGTGNDEGSSVAVDNTGNVHITGFFRATADFDPGVAVYNLSSAGGQDTFVWKLDSSGEFLWAKQLGGTSNDTSRSVAVDVSGNIYSIGSFGGTADLDPGDAIYNFTTAGSADVFVSKLDSSGRFVWAKQLGGIGNDESKSVAVDGSGNIITTGYFNGIADFDPSDAVTNLTSAGQKDVFVSRLNSAGEFLWVKQLGGIGNDGGYSVAVDGSGNIITSGYFLDTADFDPGDAVINLTSAGEGDMFVWKLNPIGIPTTPTTTVAPPTTIAGTTTTPTVATVPTTTALTPTTTVAAVTIAATKPVLTTKIKVSAKQMALYLKMKYTTKSPVTIRVMSSSKSVCTSTASAIRATKKGKCSVIVGGQNLSGRKITRTVIFNVVK